jgi:hypothetical protein
MRTILEVLAVALFLIAGVSAAGWWLTQANPVSVIAFGLACFTATWLVPDRPLR